MVDGIRAVIVWINGAFGSGKTTVATEVHRRLPGSMLYDPEMVGFFLGHVVPESDSGDFQDLPIWRTMVGDLAQALVRHYGGPLVVPMTVVDPGYLDEIVGPVRAAGITVHLFALDVATPGVPWIEQAHVYAATPVGADLAIILPDSPWPAVVVHAAAAAAITDTVPITSPPFFGSIEPSLAEMPQQCPILWHTRVLPH